MHEATYTYSQLSAASAGHLIALHYGFAPLRCRFYVLGLHDNYLVESATGKFMLRIYRNSWRSQVEAGFELDLLAFLQASGAPVAGPVRTVDGTLAFRIDSPEGERTAALFFYAQGRAPSNEISPDESARLGHAVARVHELSAEFSTVFSRQPLDLSYLLDASVDAVSPFVASEEWSYLGELQARLHAVLPGLAIDERTYGICIGDVNPTNFHIDSNQRVTLFDLDQCGYGYRAFDIGKFFASIPSHHAKRAIEEEFLVGYQDIRALSADELMMIPYFELLSIIWVMAIHVYNVDRIGHKFLERPFWERRLAILRELDARLEWRKP